LAACITLILAGWTLPAIRRARQSLSPPAAAITWIRQNLDPQTATIYVHGSMGPHADYFLTAYHRQYVEALPAAARGNAWYLTEGTTGMGGGRQFAWPHDRLWQISRQRYFEVSVVPLTSIITFGEGWYDEERDGTTIWRWMGGESRTLLPPIDGPSVLRLQFYAPVHAFQRNPAVEIRVDGVLLERFVAAEHHYDRTYDVPGSEAVRHLVITTTEVVTPSRQRLGDDPRALGLRLDAIEWRGTTGTQGFGGSLPRTREPF
jgi:hypothetical protein